MTSKQFFSFLAFGILSQVVFFDATLLLGDSALYANISKDFCLTNDFINIYVDGQDWLDKPHFTFWVNAIFMKIFGISAFSFRLCSFIFLMIGVFYSYLLASKIYSRSHGYITATILFTCLHILLSNSDVRAESILLGLLIGGMYHLIEFVKKDRNFDLILFSVFVGFAIMTKGIFICLVYYPPLLFTLFWTKNLEVFKSKKWLFHFFLVLILISPELYAVYTQFDLHPEKWVFGKQNVSGIKFFLWDSQFGRFFNTGPITRHGNLIFFLHSLLWTMAPWTILGFYAWWKTLIGIIKNNEVRFSTIFLFSSFTFMLVVFSMSGFQLPHYSNIIFPFMAILISPILAVSFDWEEKIAVRPILDFVIIAYILLFVGVILYSNYFFLEKPDLFNWIIVVCLLLIGGGIVLLKNNRVLSVGISALLFMIFMNYTIYPELSKYQSGSKAAKYLNERLDENTVVVKTNSDWLLEFYANFSIKNVGLNKDLIMLLSSPKPTLIYGDNELKDFLDKNNIQHEIEKEFDYFRVDKMTLQFFNYSTRQRVLEKRYLLKVKSKNYECDKVMKYVVLLMIIINNSSIFAAANKNYKNDEVNNYSNIWITIQCGIGIFPIARSEHFKRRSRKTY